MAKFTHTRGRVFGAIVAICAAVTLTTVSTPALAHDELVSSNPSENQRLASSPQNVTLTFSDNVMSVGTAATVVDSGTGRNWASGDAQVKGTVVTVPMEPNMPESAYEVHWRIVSADGHPVTGRIPFAIGDKAPLTADDIARQKAEEDAKNAAQVTAVVVIVCIAAVVLAAIVIGLILFLRRRKKNRAAMNNAPDETKPPTNVKNRKR